MAAAQSSGKSSRQGHAREALLGQGLSWLQENYAECDPESQWINTLKEMTMAQFLWTDDLSTGNSMIDNDHRKLINMANSFFDAMSNGQGNEIQSKVLNNLIAYTKEHFSREEAEMQ